MVLTSPFWQYIIVFELSANVEVGGKLTFNFGP